MSKEEKIVKRQEAKGAVKFELKEVSVEKSLVKLVPKKIRKKLLGQIENKEIRKRVAKILKIINDSAKAKLSASVNVNSNVKMIKDFCKSDNPSIEYKANGPNNISGNFSGSLSSDITVVKISASANSKIVGKVTVDTDKVNIKGTAGDLSSKISITSPLFPTKGINENVKLLDGFEFDEDFTFPEF